MLKRYVSHYKRIKRSEEMLEFQVFENERTVIPLQKYGCNMTWEQWIQHPVGKVNDLVSIIERHPSGIKLLVNQDQFRLISKQTAYRTKHSKFGVNK